MQRLLFIAVFAPSCASLTCNDLARLYTENNCCGNPNKTLTSGHGGAVATCGNIPLQYLDRSCCGADASPAVTPQPAWEKVFDQPPFGLQAHHTFAFVLHGTVYMVTGNLRKVSGGDYFSDAFYKWSLQNGFSDLGPFPGGKRGYAIGDVMQDTQKVYFGFGMTHLPPGQFACRYGGTPYRACGVNTSFPRLRDLWSFDGNANNKWTQLADHPGAVGRTHPAFVALRGKIYMGMGFGELLDGTGTSGDLRDVWMYDVQSDSWTELVPLPRPAHHPFQFSVGSQHAYFMFGHNLSKVYNDVYRHRFFIDGSDVWEQMASLPGQGRVAGAQFSHGGYGFVLGGEALDTESGANVVIDVHDNHRSMATGEFWRYDPQANAWAKLPSAPGRSRWAVTAFVHDDFVYMLLGSIRQGHGNNKTEEFPATGFRYYLGNCTGPRGMCQGQGLVVSSTLRSTVRTAWHVIVACLAMAALQVP